MGIKDTFGKSGNAEKLLECFKLTANDIAETMMKE